MGHDAPVAHRPQSFIEPCANRPQHLASRELNLQLRLMLERPLIHGLMTPALQASAAPL
jgi:hypothetical protein